MNEINPAIRASRLPNGARFYRCALQINPFAYLKAHSKQTRFPNEEAYNSAIVSACKDNGIEVIAITDHYQVRTAERLREAAHRASIAVFPGFEAVTKDGVHLLCLFDPARELASLERILGDCGIHDDSRSSPTGKYDATEMLIESRKWGALCIAAHVASAGGLLSTLSGQSRINAWQSPLLLACSLPAPPSEAPDNVRPILENKNPEHRRERAIAVVNAQDVSSPEDVAKPAASCSIKMSAISIEGLRQAFLDPCSRIRLASQPTPEEHAEFVAVAWQGGFLHDAAIHFNENLNVLIGGRGTGKSTVIESLRYVVGCEPLGEEAQKGHAGIVSHVLRSGTKISLRVLAHKPTKREYLIERTIPNPPLVRDESGNVLSLKPTDVIGQAEFYGQHEISELTRSREKLTLLLERFVEKDPNLARRKSDLKREMERSRHDIINSRGELKRIADALASLPALEETLKRFQEAGLEDRLKEQSLLVREEAILKGASDRATQVRGSIDQLRRLLPIDRKFISPEVLELLPGKEILARADDLLERLSTDLESLAAQMLSVVQQAEQGLKIIADEWGGRKKAVQASYEKILRDLQRSKIDGAEFIRLRREIEELRPLKEQQSGFGETEKEQTSKRRNLLVSWEDVKAEEFRRLEVAAKKVSRKLSDRVRVQVAFAGNREPLFELLRSRVGGRLSEAVDALTRRDSLSLPEFAHACRSGSGSLAHKFRLSPTQAERLSQMPDDAIMEIEELELTPTTKVELNIGPEGQPPVWQSLDELSTGQKATAVLLLLLLESDAPLVVDQPEDDLDNRFITDGIVPKMRDEKRHRQFIFATHNANIPVLGDAELIVGLTAAGEPGQGRAKIPIEYMGSIDTETVRELVEEVLEGGKEAFEMRRLKYGF